MDIDLLKSAPEDQMEMMMMMQMDKHLPEFCGTYNDIAAELPSMGFSGGGSATSMHQIFDNNPHIASPTFMNSPTAAAATISFNGTTPPQEASSAAPAFLANSAIARWRGGSGELSGLNTPAHHQKRNSMAAMREMIFRIAAMQPIHIDPESVKPPKRRNVKISKDPQSVAARHRRERISEKIRILQRLVPGGTKMDTASMLDEAIHYVKFLKTQVQSLERAAANRPAGIGFPVTISNGSYLPFTKPYQPPQNLHHYPDA